MDTPYHARSHVAPPDALYQSIDPITFSPSLSLPSPSSVAPMGLFSQPMDLPSLQTYASISMGEFAADGDFEKSPVATLPAGGQIGASAGKSAWYVVVSAFIGGEYGLGGEEAGPSRSGRRRGYHAFSKRGEETLTGGGRGKLVKGPSGTRVARVTHA
jgi:hypothetical protein